MIKNQIIEIQALLDQVFPNHGMTIESVGGKQARVRKSITSRNLRPGNTVSGPTLMALADTALYVAILGEIGMVPLAVTTNLNINFLSKPVADRDVIAQCELIKVGKRLAIGEVRLYSEGDPEPVAHATGTYSIPPR